eukprot:CAMPEP_0119485430 /NCGR_PEP_ID=MMETSP1344-20130328/12139_1 /TAXON_ID=236787 /ORGANISM="Florenciella parvula, Strain CCMP2471" /LENGTH=98 /DNA_ID=CAMNT_0007520105 /DNA_START=89 /DNA_END=381 /DNA_ORIENTATION=+
MLQLSAQGVVLIVLTVIGVQVVAFASPDRETDVAKAADDLEEHTERHCAITPGDVEGLDGTDRDPRHEYEHHVTNSRVLSETSEQIDQVVPHRSRSGG